MSGSAEGKERGILLTAWLILMLLSNAISAATYLLAKDAILTLIPSLPLWAVYFLGAGSLINVIFTVFLFMWKKWAFYGFCGVAGLAFVVNLYVGLGPASIFGLLGPLILYALLKPKWHMLE